VSVFNLICDWHASHAKILQREPIETSSQPI
jgi:hypothetical protein